MLLDDLVFRLEHFKSSTWDGTDCFALYKLKALVDQYEEFFDRLPGFSPGNVFELGIFDGGSTAFWQEVFHPKKLVAIDVFDRADLRLGDIYLLLRGLR